MLPNLWNPQSSAYQRSLGMILTRPGIPTPDKHSSRRLNVTLFDTKLFEYRRRTPLISGVQGRKADCGAPRAASNGICTGSSVRVLSRRDWSPRRGRGGQPRCSGRCPQPGAGWPSSAGALSASWRCRPGGRSAGTGASSCRGFTAHVRPDPGRTRRRLPGLRRPGLAPLHGGAESAPGTAHR